MTQKTICVTLKDISNPKMLGGAVAKGAMSEGAQMHCLLMFCQHLWHKRVVKSYQQFYRGSNQMSSRFVMAFLDVDDLTWWFNLYILWRKELQVIIQAYTSHLCYLSWDHKLIWKVLIVVINQARRGQQFLCCLWQLIYFKSTKCQIIVQT